MAFVYMLRCSDGSFYTGWTTHVQRRVLMHQAGKGARYTRARLPVELCYVEEVPDRSTALRRENAIKQMSHTKKEQLVQLSLSDGQSVL
ncbi:GIY-YIG nuclease family protein [Sulfoacidibacillus thermotolerans]|uniref:GIY-YIG domain-containing protein n=1 Tax=Sulfoacidibacillus thermotolerans TaxID=1765684 RepID=A0A2U3DC98_SULT2|nr:GIY-YIG nuclease family protein [Sulfoacidibacillus thermotolerans]PWI58898.1 hypothetical protein BM613_02100 [Sulfoacidibacillus thermotolerans]